MCAPAETRTYLLFQQNELQGATAANVDMGQGWLLAYKGDSKTSRSVLNSKMLEDIQGVLHHWVILSYLLDLMSRHMLSITYGCKTTTVVPSSCFHNSLKCGVYDTFAVAFPDMK